MYLLYITHSFYYHGITNIFDVNGNLIVKVGGRDFYINGSQIMDPESREIQMRYPMIRNLISG